MKPAPTRDYQNILMNTKLIVRLLGYLIALSGVFVYAQEDPRMWATDGVPLRQGHHLEWNQTAARNADGYTCVVWADSRSGPQNIYAQLIGPDGALLWSEEGIAPSAHPSRKMSPAVAAVEGGWIIAWIDLRHAASPSLNEQSGVCAQKLDMNGNRLWTLEGIEVYYSAGTRILTESLTPVDDLAGGTLLAWNVNYQNDALLAQHISAAGQLLWNESLLVSDMQTSMSSTKASAASDGQGNLLLAWANASNPNDMNIFAAKVTGTGSLPWGNGTGGVMVCGLQEEQMDARICPDFTSGGCYVAWRDWRSVDSDELYMQRLGNDGVAQWAENGILLSDANGQQYGLKLVPSINNGSQDGCLSVWQSDGWERFTVAMQKTSSEGEHLWVAGGITICDDLRYNYASELDLISDQAGGSIVGWEGYLNSGYEQRVTRINSNGDPSWSRCGSLIQAFSTPRYGWSISGTLSFNGDFSGVYVIHRAQSEGSVALGYQVLDTESGDLMQEEIPVILHEIEGNASYPKTVEMSGERVAIVWSDDRMNGSYFYQIVDAEGQTQFESGGRVLVAAGEESYLSFSTSQTLSPDGNGGFYMVFELLDAAGYHVQLTHVDETGAVTCGESGFAIATLQNSYNYPMTVSDGSDGCFVFWSGANPDWTSYVDVMHANINCTVSWPAPVRIIPGSDFYDGIDGLAASTEGCCIAAWHTGDYYDASITTAKICASGDMVWELTIADANGSQELPQVIQDGNGGAFYAWSDTRNTANEEDLYAQHVDTDGNELWAHNGVPVITADSSQSSPRLVYQPDYGLYVLWGDRRNTYANADIYAQRLDDNGSLLWNPMGEKIGTSSSWYSMDIVPTGTGGFFAAWSDNDTVKGSDVFPNGSVTNDWWEEDTGGLIANRAPWNGDPVLASFSNNHKLVIWNTDEAVYNQEETRRDLYMQMIATSDSIMAAVQAHPPSPLGYTLHQNYPNPFNPTTTISFSIAKAGLVSLTVYDLLGRSVTTLLNEHLNSGSYQVPWDAGSLPSGMYFYRLNAGGFSDVKKTVLLK
jgi:hypothetical protein